MFKILAKKYSPTKKLMINNIFSFLGLTSSTTTTLATEKDYQADIIQKYNRVLEQLDKHFKSKHTDIEWLDRQLDELIMHLETGPTSENFTDDYPNTDAPQETVIENFIQDVKDVKDVEDVDVMEEEEEDVEEDVVEEEEYIIVEEDVVEEEEDIIEEEEEEEEEEEWEESMDEVDRRVAEYMGQILVEKEGDRKNRLLERLYRYLAEHGDFIRENPTMGDLIRDKMLKNAKEGLIYDEYYEAIFGRNIYFDLA